MTKYYIFNNYRPLGRPHTLTAYSIKWVGTKALVSRSIYMVPGRVRLTFSYILLHLFTPIHISLQSRVMPYIIYLQTITIFLQFFTNYYNYSQRITPFGKGPIWHENCRVG